MWWCLKSVFMNVTHNANDREQAHVPIHVSEFNRVPDRILSGPPLTGQRFADHCHMLGIRRIPLIERPSSNQWNAKDLKISIGCHAEIRRTKPLLLLKEDVKP